MAPVLNLVCRWLALARRWEFLDAISRNFWIWNFDRLCAVYLSNSRGSLPIICIMVFQIKISEDQSWIVFSMKYSRVTKFNNILRATSTCIKQGCFGRRTMRHESFLLHAEIFQKKLALFEKSRLLAVVGRFCMGVLWRGFDWKMPIFGSWSGILAGCSARRGNFFKKCKGLSRLSTYY
jgi:hypothetical protein